MEFQISLGEDGTTKAMKVIRLKGSSVQGSKRDGYGGDGGGGSRGGWSKSRWRSDRGDRGGNGGGGGGATCHKYGDYGHLARDCTQESEDTGKFSGDGCYSCGKERHFARE